MFRGHQASNGFWWRAAGYGFVGLGAIGIVVPLMPTTIFWIVAVWFLLKGRDPMARRLLAHPAYGQALRDWYDRGAIARHGKIGASLALCVGLALLWITLHPALAVMATAIAAAMALSVFLWSRPLP